MAKYILGTKVNMVQFFQDDGTVIPATIIEAMPGTVTQVKEKFGGLRFYIGTGTPEIWNRISQAETESEETCQTCGKPGKISTWDRWWLLCFCPEHGEERKNSKL
jgi:ribosomal protein L3